jgi:hypothetical protein
VCVCVCVCVFESRLQVGRDGSVIACVGMSLSPRSLLVFFVYAAAGLCLRALLLLSLPPCCCCLAVVALVSLSPHSFDVLLWQSLLLLRLPRFLLLRSPSVLLSGSLVRVRRCCRALAALPHLSLLIAYLPRFSQPPPPFRLCFGVSCEHDLRQFRSHCFALSALQWWTLWFCHQA